MADPFPVDPPEPIVSAEVPHADVHAALADALGVPADSVDAAPADPNDAPLAKPFAEIYKARAGGNDGLPKFDNATLPRDPAVAPRKGDTIGSLSDYAPTPPKADPSKEFWGENKAAVQSILAQASAEQPPLPGIEAEGGAASPGPGPFRERAAISQRIKRLLRSPVLIEVEGEGFDQLAQIVARIMTTHDAANARAAWNELGRLCDDVAEALR